MKMFTLVHDFSPRSLGLVFGGVRGHTVRLGNESVAKRGAGLWQLGS